jgi:hypothetical protein
MDVSQETRWLRSRPTAAGFAPEKVDAEKGILRDVVMVEEGEAKGHGVLLDEDFIRDLTEYDLRTFSNRGLKARFGHPSASNDTMGTQMGIFKNFRTRRTSGKLQSIADLHLLEAADESPTHPGMRAWMLKMATERPDFVMMSIVFRAGGYFQKKANGHKVYIANEWSADPNLGDVFVEFGAEGEHFYTDAVEQGAATDNLFGTKVNPDFFVSRAHQWLDDNPDILQFVKDNPQRVQFFLQRLGISIQHQPQQKKMSKFSLWKWLNGEAQEGEPTTADLDTLQTELADAKAAVTAFQSGLAETERQKEALENRVKEFESEVASLQANVAQLKTEAETLKADATAKAAEIERLKAEPAAGHTAGETEPPSNEALRPYELNPIYQKALAMRRKARVNA